MRVRQGRNTRQGSLCGDNPVAFTQTKKTHNTQIDRAKVSRRYLYMIPGMGGWCIQLGCSR